MPRNQEDADLALVLSRTLRIGVLVAVAGGVAGAALYLSHGGTAHVDFREFHGADVPYASVSRVLHDAFSGDSISTHARGAALAEVGIFALVLTPILRVLLSFVGFLRERDWIYVGITSVVIGSLTWSLLLR